MNRLLLLLLLFPTAAPGESAPRFAERSTELGLVFEHNYFGTGEKYMPENMGSGVALFDADGDGRLDVYFVQGAPLSPSAEPDPEATNRLFLQGKDGNFRDVTTASGAGDRGYGMGVIYGDYDGDGDDDLYVTNFGPNVLLRNDGPGPDGIPRFTDATDAGVGDPAWSAGSTFFDLEGDGDLDLFVSNYVAFAFDHHKWCGNAQRKLRSYCHPDVYDGLADTLYRNDGGRFTNISADSNLRPAKESKGLGVLAADFNGDGHQDIYVANDSTMNHLYLGDDKGRLREEALLTGLGFNGSGAAEASMGLTLGDFTGDGQPELFATHLDRETNTLYRPVAPGLWRDATERAGLAAPGLPWVGFGTLAFDHDHDGDLDLLVVNGHILDNIALFDPTRSHRQPAQLFDNKGDGTFTELNGALGLNEPLVGRGAAAGDLDGDGALDLVITQNGGPARVLINLQGQDHASLRLRLQGPTGNLHAWGTHLELITGKKRQTRWAHPQTSYLSQGAPEIHFGLGNAKAGELKVRWPNGAESRHTIEPGLLELNSPAKPAG